MAKGIDALNLAAGPPTFGGAKGPGDGTGESEGGAKVRAMRRLGQALAAKRYDQAAAAFKEAYDACAEGHDDEEPEGEEYPEAEE